MLHQHLYKIYGHQTLQGCDLPWGTSTCKATRFFVHMIKWGHVANQELYIFLHFPFSLFLRLWIRNHIKKCSFCLFIKGYHLSIVGYSETHLISQHLSFSLFWFLLMRLVGSERKSLSFKFDLIMGSIILYYSFILI